MSLLVKDILTIGKNQLEKMGCPDAKIDAELLFCHMMNIDKSRLFLSWPQDLPDELCEKYFWLLDIRSGGMPLQHITGYQEFMGLKFSVNDKVLIPRPETETMVETALMLMTQQHIKKVLDLCTGSGAIAISLDKQCETAFAKKVKLDITASDISAEALEVARGNAVSLGSKNVKFIQGDLFEPFKKQRIGKQAFDLIIANPPYIKSSEIPNLQVEVRDHEPILALDGGYDGLEICRKIIDEAPKYLKKGGILLMEIGHDQAEIVKALATVARCYATSEVFKDLAGRDRIAMFSVEEK